MTSVGEMSRRGWTKTGVKPGDKIKVTYHPVRDGRVRRLHGRRHDSGWSVYRPATRGAKRAGRPTETR